MLPPRLNAKPRRREKDEDREGDDLCHCRTKAGRCRRDPFAEPVTLIDSIATPAHPAQHQLATTAPLYCAATRRPRAYW